MKVFATLLCIAQLVRADAVASDEEPSNSKSADNLFEGERALPEMAYSLCSAHPKCAHLEASCCPTTTGQYLDCCEYEGKGKGKGKGVSKGKGKGKGVSKGKGAGSKGKGMGMMGPGMSMGMMGKGKGLGEDFSKGKGKGGMDRGNSQGKGGGKGGKGGKGQSYSQPCRHTVFEVTQVWDEPLVEPDGELVVDAKDASVNRGQRWSFVDNVLDKECSRNVGFSAESRTRLNKGEKWHNDGTFIDLYGCSGYLSFTGSFSDSTNTGTYTITGGTGDFSGATGYIKETFEYDSLYSHRTIVIE